MNQNYFQNKNILITAGPTYEKIDPVRFIGNFSSGKMGFELALAAANLGANVTLISGPTCLDINHPKVNRINVVSALEMYEECLKHFDKIDISILAAAVADYRPAFYSDIKIKKKDDDMNIQLTKNPDIFKTLGQQKRNNQLIIGFALETNNEIENAKNKLNNKNGDAIVLNSLNDFGSGFKHSTNKITIILKNGSIFEFDLKDKKEVAIDILTCISRNF